MNASYDGTVGGQPPYDPWMMVSLLLYSYCVGVVSSRKAMSYGRMAKRSGELKSEIWD
ncbi:MAG: transposase [bacterium]|nr:transposase [bacterium]